MRKWLTQRVATPTWVLLVLGLFALGGLMNVARGSGSQSTTTQQTQTTQKGTQANPTRTQAKPTPTHTPKWTTIQTFSGNGISKTAPFTVNANQWRIVWSCNPAAYGSEYNLIADLTVPSDSYGESVVNVICKQDAPSTTSGQTMEYTAGTFYLDVNSEASWTFQIQILK